MKSIVTSMIAVTWLIATSNVLATEMPELAKKHNCIACHKIDERYVGPAWMDVSKFYNGKMDRTPTGMNLAQATGGKSPEEWLQQKISNGGTGNWNKRLVMPHNDPDGKYQQDIKELIKFILGLAK